jgi:hypothetical protein
MITSSAAAGPPDSGNCADVAADGDDPHRDDDDHRALASSLSKRLGLRDEGGGGGDDRLPAKDGILIHGDSGGEDRGLGFAAVREPIKEPPASDAERAKDARRPDDDEPRGRQRTRVLVCDLGYGFPREERPRRERVLAVAKQLVNFLEWQQLERRRGGGPGSGQLGEGPDRLLSAARLVLVDCLDPDIRSALTGRMIELWNANRQEQRGEEGDDGAMREGARRCRRDLPFPSDLVEFAAESLSSFASSLPLPPGSVVYLSPDAGRALDAGQPPPDAVVVGMLIDRRVRPGRSLRRAGQVGVEAARLPLELASSVLDRGEPLNVDCVLEGLQQWHWNCDGREGAPDEASQRGCFERAFAQALRHHQERHPERPVHKTR